MGRIWFLTLIAIGTSILLLPRGTPAQPVSDSPAAIRHEIATQAAAWNRGDMNGFVRGYDDSPKTALVGRTVEYGYSRILEIYKKAYASPSAMGRLRFTGLTVRMLGPGYAVVTGDFHVERAKTAGGNEQGIFSLVFAKRAAGWKIILDHSSAD